jgi:serine/threonine protein kinase
MFARKNDINSLKLIDFGLSGKYESTNILRDKCGTGMYMAPEVFTDYQYTKVLFEFTLVRRFVECWNYNVYPHYW